MNKFFKVVVCMTAVVVVFSILTAPVYAQYCATQPAGAVAWWTFDEGSGATAYDIVSGYDGTLNGAPTHVVGFVDSALEFSGSLDYVRVTHNSALSIVGDLTVELWYRYDGGVGGTLLTKGIQTSGGTDYPMSYFIAVSDAGSIQAGYESQTGANQIMTTPTAPTPGQWHFLAYRRVGSYHELYVDSLVAVSETTSLTPGSDSNDLTIGAIHNEGNMIKFFDGGIDEVTIYNRALDASEILAVYNAGSAGKCKEIFTDVTTPVLQDGVVGGSGFAWGDYDDDGDKDVYIANESGGHKLLRNDGDGIFTDVTTPVLTDANPARGATWADYDNDGDLDLFRAGSPNKLFNNEGGGVFVDSTTIFQGGGGNSLSNTWADFDNDGDLDVFSSKYAESHYFRNDGDVFTNATTGPLVISGGRANNTADYDNDGDQDLFVAADLSTLLRNDGGGVFTDVSVAPLQCCANWGLSWGDYDNDGDVDISQGGSSGTILFRNDGGGVWTRAEPAEILACASQGVAWGDYNNDGYLDLYTVGNNNHLFRNDGGGAFTDVTTIALGDADYGRACDWVDYDDDGDLDIFFVDAYGANKLLRNNLPRDHHWLQVDLVGSISNLDGVGSRVRVVTGGLSQIREVTIGTSARSQGALTVAFGLGTSSVADTVEVRWPSGIMSEVIDVSADQRIVISESGVLVTLTTDPPGLDVELDGDTYTAPYEFASGAGATRTIAVTSPQVHGDTSFVFSSWSDGGAISHSIAPTTDTTYTASFDMLFTYAFIDSVVDVPGDQGGWARIHFLRSVYDDIGETTNPITTYAIHRRVDNLALVSQILETGKRTGGDTPLASLGDRQFRIIESPDAAAPPGVWEVLGTVPARQQDNYIYLAPTLADSMETLTYSVYFIAAHTPTPSVYFDSPPDSGYSVDNIAPAVPPAFLAVYNTGSGNTLTWDPVPDNDLQYYKIYRGTEVGFTPSPGNQIDVTTSTTWSDPEYDGWQVYYKVTAVDDAGNEGDAAGWDPASGVDNKPVIPDRFALHQNVPNPFNPATTIRYDVPAGGGHISLRIYDVAGRLVRTLVDGEQSPGGKSMLWNGRNDQGTGVATGVYFYRLTAPGFEQTRKMILVQ